MDTVKRSSVESVDQLYDGFISYSHAADDLLAPRLQSALQRFAKPWWKRRAVRIFRDESSLSANPHLWSSITEALDTSGWFVLLLSPDAAQSEWVNQEIAYWVENRDPKRILPVVTDGEFGWDGGEVVGDAVPGALRGVFSEEPRWVDVRWAKDEDQLDLQDPRFADAVADIASTIRGVPKDDLASEEVRQHRRTVRTAWAAGVALVLLSVAAVGAALFAFGQQNEANRQRDLAEANENRALAGEQRALEEAANAEARRLAVTATAALSTDAHLAMLLALEAHHAAPLGEVRREIIAVLREAAIENRLVGRVEVGKGLNYVRISPDGSTLYHASGADNRLSAIDLETTAVLWVYEDRLELTQVSITPDGRLVAVALVAPDGQTSRVEVLDAATGSSVATVASGSGCNHIGLALGGFSSSGRWVSMRAGSDNCDFWTTEDDWAVVYDSRAWEQSLRYEVEDAWDERLVISDARNLAVGTYIDLNFHWWAEILNFPELEQVAKFPIDNGRSVALHGDTVYYDVGGDEDYQVRIRVKDVSSGNEATLPVPELLNTGGYFCQELDECFEFEMLSVSPDGAFLSVVGMGRDVVVGVADDDLLEGPGADSIALLSYDDSVTYDASWTADGSTLVTAHEDQLLVWAVVPDGRRLEGVVRSGDWVGFAQSQLVRGFTEGECITHLIDPCPTLDEMRSR